MDLKIEIDIKDLLEIIKVLKRAGGKIEDEWNWDDGLIKFANELDKKYINNKLIMIGLKHLFD